MALVEVPSITTQPPGRRRRRPNTFTETKLKNQNIVWTVQVLDKAKRVLMTEYVTAPTRATAAKAFYEEMATTATPQPKDAASMTINKAPADKQWARL
jgi:hypothetical protein